MKLESFGTWQHWGEIHDNVESKDPKGKYGNALKNSGGKGKAAGKTSRSE